MRQLWLVLALTIFLSGCANRKPLAPDAFFGRTAVPPPPTQSARNLRAPYAAAPRLLPADADRGGVQVATTPSANRSSTSSGSSGGWKSANASPSAASPINNQLASDLSRQTATPSTPAQASSSSGVSSASFAATDFQPPAQPPVQPIVRVLQPRATAAGHQTPAADLPGPKASLAPAVTDTSTWSSRSMDAQAAGNLTVPSTPSTSLQPQALRSIVPSNRVIPIGDLPDPGTRAVRQPRVDASVQPASFSSASSPSQSAPAQPATSGELDAPSAFGAFPSDPSVGY